MKQQQRIKENMLLQKI